MQKKIIPILLEKKILHKNFKDPSQFDDNIENILYEYRKIRDEIKEFIIEIFDNKKN